MTIRRITMIMIVSIVISGSLRKQTIVTPQGGESPATHVHSSDTASDLI